jgi:hypothetical protein
MFYELIIPGREWKKLVLGLFGSYELIETNIQNVLLISQLDYFLIPLNS